MRGATNEFLLKDYEANSSLLGMYVSMRFAAVGATLPVVGYLLTLRTPEGALAARFGSLLLVLVANFAALRILGAINRNIYARCLHLAWVEAQLGELGFYRYWDKFARRCASDTSSYAIVVAARSVNVVVAAFVGWESFWAARNVSLPVAVGLAVFVLLSGIKNELYIRRQLCESGFLPRLTADLAAARDEARREVVEGGERRLT